MAEDSFLRITVGWEIGLFQLQDVRAWASKELSDVSEEATRNHLVELVRAKANQTDLISDTLAALAGSKICLVEHEDVAKEIWPERVARYVQEDLPPRFLCGVIWKLEELYDFPEWLGDIYNACDWSGETSSRADFPQVEQEASEILRRFGGFK